MVTERKTWSCFISPLFLMIMLLALTLYSPPISWGSDSATGATFSLNLQNETLGSVIKKISSATGYEIFADDHCLKFPITASVQDTDIIDGLRRILKSYNHSLIEDKKSRKIKILIFGKKDSKEASLSRYSTSDIDKYAEKYIKSRKQNPESIHAKNIDAYAQEYARRVEKRNQEPIQADNIDDYAEQYIRRAEHKNPKPAPI